MSNKKPTTLNKHQQPLRALDRQMFSRLSAASPYEHVLDVAFHWILYDKAAVIQTLKVKMSELLSIQINHTRCEEVLVPIRAHFGESLRARDHDESAACWAGEDAAHPAAQRREEAAALNICFLRDISAAIAQSGRQRTRNRLFHAGWHRRDVSRYFSRPNSSFARNVTAI